MKKVTLFLVLLSILAIMTATNVAAAQGTRTAEILTANGTENNGNTNVSINVRCIGDNASYYVNISWNLEGALYDKNNASVYYVQDLNFNDTVHVINNTDTVIKTNRTLTEGTVFWYNITCYNDTTDESDMITNGSVWKMFVNKKPVINRVETTGGALIARRSVTFAVDWTDTNSSEINASSVDDNTLYVCSAFSATTKSCSGTEYCTSSEENDNGTSCSYTIPVGTVAGPTTVTLALVDDNSYDSVTSTSTFRVSAPTSDEDEEGETSGIVGAYSECGNQICETGETASNCAKDCSPTPTAPKKSKGVSPFAIIFVLLFIIIVAVVIYKATQK